MNFKKVESERMNLHIKPRSQSVGYSKETPAPRPITAVVIVAL